MISVAVSALNEEKHVQHTVKNILAAGREAGGIPLDILFIDDGSTDGTSGICEELAKTCPGVRVMRHERNAGVSANVREALEAAIYPRFISLPGSNDVSKTLLTELFVRRKEADLVLSYYVNQAERGWLRRTFSFLFRNIYAWTFRVNVRYLTGPAIYRTESLRRLRLQSYGFSIFPEMTLKTILSGSSYIEIPGRMIQSDRKSTALFLRNLVEIVVVYLKLVWEIKFQAKGKK